VRNVAHTAEFRMYMYSFCEIIGRKSGKEKTAWQIMCRSEGNIGEHSSEQLGM
jgi:hypothetical protein